MKMGTLRTVICLMLVLLLLPTSAMAKKYKQMEDDVPMWSEDTVREYAIDYIEGRDMTRLWGYYDLQIRRYMPLSSFENFLCSLEWMTGAFLGLGSYSSFAEPEHELKTHVLHLCMEKQDIDMYLTHKDKEADWEIMALQFVPSEKQALPSSLDATVDTAYMVSDGFTESNITIGASGQQLKGILTMPDDVTQPVPACVLVHDRGALDMNGSEGSVAFFSDLAHALAKMGIASVRYDKRTYTYGENPEWTAWEETVEDAILAGQLLAGNNAVDKTRMVLIGHGFGGTLAPRIALQAEGVFTAMVIIGSTPKSYAQQLLDESSANLYSADQRAEIQKTIDKLPKMKEDAARQLTLFGRNGHYFWELAQYHPIELIKKLKLKTYIVQGAQDAVVTQDDGWRMYSEEIGDGITYVGFKSFRGLNHWLMKESDPSHQLDQSAGKNISQWILGLNQVVEE